MNQAKSVLVTGSSSGFGRLITKTLVAKGYTVVATMRDSDGRNGEQAQTLQTFAAGQVGKLHIVVTLEAQLA